MINAFELQNWPAPPNSIEDQADLEHVKPIWIDFDDPTDEERRWANRTMQT